MSTLKDPDRRGISRRLLTRLRDVLAGGGEAQARLDRIARVIAEQMTVDVCSVYVMRAGEVLELFATHGLSAQAVHATRLRVGEGLVGDIAAHARPLGLADAWSHPGFAYRPETGEEVYRSLMGVPVLRGSRVSGVVAVQTIEQRDWSGEDIEILETVSMIVAELLAAGEVVSAEETKPVDGIGLLPLRLEGIALNPGVAIGLAVPHQPAIRIGRLVAEDPAAEHAHLAQALETLGRQLDQLESLGQGASEDFRDVMGAYRMFAEDKGWIGRIGEAIDGGLTAAAAVQKVHDDMRLKMQQITDPYLRERLLDLEDLTNRLLTHLTGDQVRRELPRDAILVARALGPTELLDYDRERLRGLVMEEGSRTMHAVIIARALGIPVVARIKDVFDRIDAYDPVIVDGDHGQLFLRPSEDVVETFRQSVEARQQRQARHAALRDLPAHTIDGVEVNLMMNAGLLLDLPHLEAHGADGIGLYRTELPFMARAALPDVAAQTGLYARILDHAGERPVVFRTLDVGSDKVLPYWPGAGEENPAMGWRSIRITLDRPAILRQQLRALLRAAEGRELRVMFPMVATVAEFRAARRNLEREITREQTEAEAAGRPPRLPARTRVGTMLEVPSLLFQLPALLPEVDFVSVGSNDLLQFLFACDRGNQRLEGRYDALSPPVLNALANLVAACRDAGVPLSVCGEMAGRPLEAMALLGLGVRTLSMAPPGIGPVKAMVRSLDLSEFAPFLASLLGRPDHSLRGRLTAYARDHGIALS